MKNPVEVLRDKEQELLQVKREIDALRVVLPMLSEEDIASYPRTQVPASSARKVVQLP
jgi:hypothetical protein